MYTYKYTNRYTCMCTHRTVCMCISICICTFIHTSEACATPPVRTDLAVRVSPTKSKYLLLGPPNLGPNGPPNLGLGPNGPP